MAVGGDTAIKFVLSSYAMCSSMIVTTMLMLFKSNTTSHYP